MTGGSPSALLRFVARLHGGAVFARRVRALVEAIDDLLPRDSDSLLDVGCGDGSIGAALAERRPSIRYEGVEVRPRPDCRVPVTQFDGLTLPHPARSFDHVLFVDVLHHAGDPETLLREARRVARRGVIVKDHLCEGARAAWILAFMDWIGNRPHGVPSRYEYWSSERWARAYEGARLRRVREVHDLGLYLPPLRPLFERGLHHLTLLEPA